MIAGNSEIELDFFYAVHITLADMTMGAYGAFRETLRQRSVLHRTRQAWKLSVPALVTLILVAALVTTVWLEDQLPMSIQVMLLGCFSLLLLAAIAFPCITVRCPDCGARWYWQAISGKGGGIGGLLKQPACPSCGSACNGSPTPQRHNVS